MDKKEDTGISLIKKLSFEATGEELNDTEAKAINLDSVVHEFIEKLWNEYDTNKSGVLEEKQAKKGKRGTVAAKGRVKTSENGDR